MKIVNARDESLNRIAEYIASGSWKYDRDERIFTVVTDEDIFESDVILEQPMRRSDGSVKFTIPDECLSKNCGYISLVENKVLHEDEDEEGRYYGDVCYVVKFKTKDNMDVLRKLLKIMRRNVEDFAEVLE